MRVGVVKMSKWCDLKNFQVGKYEIGRTIGEGSFAKVKFGRNVETGDFVAVKIIDKEKALKLKLTGLVCSFTFLSFFSLLIFWVLYHFYKCMFLLQIEKEITTMKLVKHPNVIRLIEVDYPFRADKYLKLLYHI